MSLWQECHSGAAWGDVLSTIELVCALPTDKRGILNEDLMRKYRSTLHPHILRAVEGYQPEDVKKKLSVVDRLAVPQLRYLDVGLVQQAIMQTVLADPLYFTVTPKLQLLRYSILLGGDYTPLIANAVLENPKVPIILARHPDGTRILQRVLDVAEDAAVVFVTACLIENAVSLCKDKYANFVVSKLRQVARNRGMSEQPVIAAFFEAVRAAEHQLTTDKWGWKVALQVETGPSNPQCDDGSMWGASELADNIPTSCGEDMGESGSDSSEV